jgi:2-methylisocitrate lyase-like PEP mutase family enzyme
MYQAAGCDGIFVPGLADGHAIETIAAAIDPLPLNVMLVPGLPSLTTLRKQGVRRLSAGSAIAQAVFGLSGRLATDFLAGSWNEMFAVAADYGAMNRLFSKR